VRDDFRAKQKAAQQDAKDAAKRILRRVSTPAGMPAVREDAPAQRKKK
jgi:hypothetical protein